MSHQKTKKDPQPSGEARILGRPGYRTRANRSGLDPVDSDNEAGYMGGVFLRKVLTLRLRTRNPWALLALFLLGVLPFAILAFLLYSALSSGNPPATGWSELIVPFIFFLVTGALTVNFVLSLVGWLGQSSGNKRSGK